MSHNEEANNIDDGLSIDQLKKNLSFTIKEDNTNKVITFLAMLTVYTEDDQLNCAFVAPSSTGKSYIPLEISSYFPEEDLMKLAYCSPQAFFHANGVYDKDLNETTIDLSRKIILFLDQPHTQLIVRLRPLISHDQKVLTSKITDKSDSGGNRTKSVRMIGYPVVVFCTAIQKIDEQEATRFMLLSPEMNAVKIKAAVRHKINKDSDKAKYETNLQSDEARESLMQLIKDIKASGIKCIKILNTELLDKLFFEYNAHLKPRHQRDISKVMGLCKALALLRFKARKKDGDTIFVNDEDIESAIQLFREIAECQDFGLSPYVFNIYRDIILPLLNGSAEHGNNVGVTRGQLQEKYQQIYGMPIAEYKLRQEILPTLEQAGLIVQVNDSLDKRRTLVKLTSNNGISNDVNNSE